MQLRGAQDPALGHREASLPYSLGRGHSVDSKRVEEVFQVAADHVSLDQPMAGLRVESQAVAPQRVSKEEWRLAVALVEIGAAVAARPQWEREQLPCLAETQQGW